LGSFIGVPSMLLISQPQGRPPDGLEVLAGEDADHARRLGGGGGVDALDAGVRIGRAQEEGVGLPGQRDVVGVLALAGEEAASSRRSTDLPMKPWRAFMVRCSSLHGGSALLHGLDDVVVAGAAADVAFQRLAHLLLACAWQPWCCTRSTALITMPGVQKPHCRPWQARKAACIGCSVPSAAARPSMVVTAGALRLRGQHVAALHRLAVHVHGAGAALRGVAADVGAGQAQVSRMNSTSRVWGGTSRETSRPLTFSVSRAMVSPLWVVVLGERSVAMTCYECAAAGIWLALANAYEAAAIRSQGHGSAPYAAVS
jgi:hypothetical protein